MVKNPTLPSADSIRGMFAAIRPSYDRFNRLLSLGRDQAWRRALVNQTVQSRARDVLDLAAGTGDVTLLLQNAGLDATAADFCEPMLEIARKKGVKKTTAADALQLPFPDRSFDAVTVAWGWRNFTDRPRAAAEIRRVLRPRGHLFILECSQPPSLLKPAHAFYLRRLAPALVGFLGGDASAYRYLATSTAAFPDAPTLAHQLRDAGFAPVTWRSFALGAIALHHAQLRPSAP